MPRRRRNPDGSLVVPLSKAQQESLARGRAKLARLQAAGGSPALSKETTGEPAKVARRSRVVVAKASGGVSKASGPVSKETGGVTKESRRQPAPVSKESAPARRSSLWGWLSDD